MLAIAGLLALAGCGGSGNDSSGSSGGGAATTQAPATTSGGESTSGGGGGGAEVKVAMKNIAFSPETVNVKVGQKITWTNDDTAPHNVTSQSGEKIMSSTFGKGGTFSFTPTKAGTIDYVCTIHPGMDGKIVVTK
jgi:plastocyanin